MDGLLQLCAKEGIEVHYISITQRKKLLGYYCHGRDGTPLIILDETLRLNRPMKRTVLGEEVGHHMTGPVGCIAGSYYSVSLDRLNRTNLSRDEARAIKWAANYLIPTHDLAEAVTRGIVTVGDIAEHFCVTEWLVWRKLHSLRSDLREQQGLRAAIRDIFSPILVDNLWGLERRGAVSSF